MTFERSIPSSGNIPCLIELERAKGDEKNKDEGGGIDKGGPGSGERLVCLIAVQ